MRTFKSANDGERAPLPHRPLSKSIEYIGPAWTVRLTPGLIEITSGLTHLALTKKQTEALIEVLHRAVDSYIEPTVPSKEHLEHSDTKEVRRTV
jgi:hypothetical protein